MNTGMWTKCEDVMMPNVVDHIQYSGDLCYSVTTGGLITTAL